MPEGIRLCQKEDDLWSLKSHNADSNQPSYERNSNLKNSVIKLAALCILGKFVSYFSWKSIVSILNYQMHCSLMLLGERFGGPNI